MPGNRGALGILVSTGSGCQTKPQISAKEETLQREGENATCLTTTYRKSYLLLYLEPAVGRRFQTPRSPSPSDLEKEEQILSRQRF